LIVLCKGKQEEEGKKNFVQRTWWNENM